MMRFTVGEAAAEARREFSPERTWGITSCGLGEKDVFDAMWAIPVTPVLCYSFSFAGKEGRPLTALSKASPTAMSGTVTSSSLPRPCLASPKAFRESTFAKS